MEQQAVSCSVLQLAWSGQCCVACVFVRFVLFGVRRVQVCDLWRWLRLDGAKVERYEVDLSGRRLGFCGF